jgi:type IV secretory pathway VirB2 component (pilin)
MLMRWLDWFFRDRRTGRIVIGQWPNLWLWIFGAASLVEIAVGAQGMIGIAARVIATVFLVMWAGDELLRGVNPWRRCLGSAVLIGLAIRLFV